MGGKGVFQSNRTKTGVQCLSCGKSLKDRRRRYCSRLCRQGLESKLDLAVGLLRTLGARFAAFSFTDSSLYFDVLPVRSEHVLTYVFQRKPGRKPAQDLWELLDGLGRAWHEKVRSTGKRYVATRHILEQARRSHSRPDSLRPDEVKRPRVLRRSLRQFALSGSDLVLPNARQAVKAAYRREAKVHHPDHGGDPASFRRIHKAHEDLLGWVKRPRFTTQRGVAGKWSYESSRSKKWLPPAVKPRGTG
jgi:hypothetical protein